MSTSQIQTFLLEITVNTPLQQTRNILLFSFFNSHSLLFKNIISLLTDTHFRFSYLVLFNRGVSRLTTHAIFAYNINLYTTVSSIV